MKKIVVSAVNLTEFGPLSILKECLEYLSDNLSQTYEIIALVNDKSLFNHKGIKFYEFPLSKKTWLMRLYYEYIYFKNFSAKIKPYLWLSLHDITPNVTAEIKAVYCHNPSPFYSLNLKEAYLGGYKFLLFNLLYRYLYSINIKKNSYVIVQQDSLRNKFKKLTGADNIIVAHPTIKNQLQVSSCYLSENSFFYPAFPRVFKNFEVIGKAAELLLKQGISNFKVYFTLSGKENRYSQHIYNSLKHIKNINFMGALSREKVFELYHNSGCIIFPSKLETWGMPITEAKSFAKPIFAADLDYAHETIGSYDKVKFFDPNDPYALAIIMKDFIDKKIDYACTNSREILAPFAEDWEALFKILLNSEK